MSEARADARATQATGLDTIGSWLAGFERVLVGTEEERRETREELEGHLRDRARDLMLAGLNADEASRRAIGELGEAVDIAASYRAIRGETHRRKAMQVAGIGLAAGAVVVSVAALLQGAGAGKASPQPELLKLVTPTLVIGQEGAGTEKSADANAGAILSLRADVEHLKAAANELRARVFEAPEDAAMKALSAVPVEVAPGATFALLLEHIKQAGTPLPRMETLAPMGVDLETKLPATQGKGTVAGVIEMMNERLGPGEKIGVRLVEGGGVEIASQAYFDQKESMLVTYDLSPIVEARTSRGDRRAPSSIVEEAAHLVMSLVEPEQWRDNGGVLAEVSVFGEKLFIQAPRRLQPKIKWILDELVTSGGAEQTSIEAKSGFPMLTSIPILSTPFTNSTPVREQVGDGPITIRACGEGRLEIIGAGGTMKANEIVIGGSEAKVEESGAH